MVRTRRAPDPQELVSLDAEETAATSADCSGWTPHPSERRDFYHRIRVFPPDVATWRQELLCHVRNHLAQFPHAATDKDSLINQIDEGIGHLREVARILAVLYRTPHLGNKQDPIDELVYIILSRKTPERAYQQTFEALKRRFPAWGDLLKAQPAEVERILYSGGLSGKKTQSLYGALGKLLETFGDCTLEPARSWSDADLESFLCSLPEIQRKSAYCIMMYAFGRQVFPADTHVGRVLTRLGPFRELGLSLSGLDHKKLQKVLTNLVPPNLRYSLHVNLIEHGRTVCKSLRPLCGQCELRSFCATFRRSEVKRIESLELPTVVDLFAGAGGLSEGFARAGFRTLVALDQDREAMRTYRLNHWGVPDDRVLVADIRLLKEELLRRLVGRKRLDVLIGAPPCQGYSTAGHRSKKSRTGYRADEDERNYLFKEMVKVALVLRPRLFLMENVPGMQSARKESLSFLQEAERMLKKGGHFTTAIWRLNASAFGVPQDRIRFFLVASSTNALPARPTEEYQDLHKPGLDHDALPPVTLQEAIFDLPSRKAGTGLAVDDRDLPDTSSDLRFRRYLTKFAILRQSRVVYNHTVRYHNPRDLELYSLLRPGEDSVHFLENHGREDLMRYRKDVFDDKYARLRPDRPSKTIVSHLAKDGNGYIHPDQVRSITLREAARLQSFHDGYMFCGSPSDQWIQLGNAVPPVLAEAIARSFLRALHRS